MKKNNFGFASLLGMLITLIIIAVLCFLMLNVYVKKPKPGQIDTSNPKAMLDDTRDKIQAINIQQAERARQVDAAQ